MPRGGKRPGAGRKKGAATKKTRKVADKVVAGGVTPLEVMVEAMRSLHASGDLTGAADIARHAAPYCHPRLGSLTIKGDKEEPVRLVEEIVIVHADPATTAPPAPGAS